MLAVDHDSLSLEPQSGSSVFALAKLDEFVSESIYREHVSAAAPPGGTPETSIAAFPDETITVAWTRLDSPNEGVFVEKRALDGQPLTAPTQVSPVAPGTVFAAPIRATALEEGQQVIVWADANGLNGMWFDAANHTSGTSFSIGNVASVTHFDIAPTSGGGFVIAWVDDSSGLLNARRFNALAQPHEPQSTLVTPAAGASLGQVQTLLHQGEDYAIVWEQVDSFGITTYYSAISNNQLVQQILLDSGSSPHAPQVAINAHGDIATAFSRPGTSGDQRIEVELRSSSGQLNSTVLVDSYVGPAAVAAPQVHVLDGGGVAVTYTTSTTSTHQLKTQYYRNTMEPIGSPVTLNQTPSWDIPLLTATPGPDWSLAASWIAFNGTSADANIVSSAYRPSFTPLSMDLGHTANPPSPIDWIVGIRGLPTVELGAGSLQNSQWVVEDLQADYLALFSSAPLPIKQVGFDFYDPAAPTTVVHQDEYLFGTSGDDNLQPGAAIEVVSGGAGHDRVELPGERRQFQFQYLGAPSEKLSAASNTSSAIAVVDSVERAVFDDIALPTAWLGADQLLPVDDAFAIDEDTPLNTHPSGISLLDNDGATHDRTAFLTTPLTMGSLTLDEQGQLVYAPDPDSSGAETLQYETRLQFWDHVSPEPGGRWTTSSAAWATLHFDDVPIDIEDGKAYQLALHLESIDVSNADVALTLDGSGQLVPLGAATAELSGQQGPLMFDFVKAAVDTKLTFETLPLGANPSATLRVKDIQLIEAGSGDVLASSASVDGLGAALRIDVHAVADAPTFTASAVYDEATSTHQVALSATLHDTDGSETLSVHVTNLPAGAIVSDGTHQAISNGLTDIIDITSWQWPSLVVSSLSGAATVSFEATATESSNGDAATTSQPLDLIPPNQSVWTIAAPGATPPTTPEFSESPPLETPEPRRLADDLVLLEEAEQRDATETNERGSPKAERSESNESDSDEDGTTDDHDDESAGAPERQGSFASVPSNAMAKPNPAGRNRQRTAQAYSVNAGTTPVNMAPDGDSDLTLASNDTVVAPTETDPRSTFATVAGRSREALTLTAAANIDLDFVYSATQDLEDKLLQPSIQQKILAGSAVVVAMGFSAGQIAWLLRGSLLLTRAISSAPVCFAFDPLPVLNARQRCGRQQRESLADIVTAGAQP